MNTNEFLSEILNFESCIDGTAIIVKIIKGMPSIGNFLFIRNIYAYVTHKSMLISMENLTENNQIKIILRGITLNEIKDAKWITYNCNPLEIFIKKGSFFMGGLRESIQSVPQHFVTINSFYIFSIPVTIGLYHSVNNTDLNKEFDSFPFNEFNFKEALLFCNSLSKLEGYNPCYEFDDSDNPIFTDTGGYRLPFESEWEYSASGGNDQHGFEYSGSNNADDVAWTDSYDLTGTKPVAKLAPNPLGIYDMSGNTYEWCYDIFDENYYQYSPSNNPQGPWPELLGFIKSRSIRGGTWYHKPQFSKIKMRDSFSVDKKCSLRIVRSIDIDELKFTEESIKKSITSFLPNFITVKSGSFYMGNFDTTKDAFPDEKPCHEVFIDALKIAEIPVTNELWGFYKSYINNCKIPVYTKETKNLPAMNISWFEACEFCNFLSELMNLEPVYKINNFITGSENTTQIEWNRKANGYRLPTEAEWEYCANGGHMAPKVVKTKPSLFNLFTSQLKNPYSLYSGGNELEKCGYICSKSGSVKKPVSVKLFKPNILGLYDMSGNIYEWCYDYYHKNYYSFSANKNPSGPQKGKERILKGGSFLSYEDDCRISGRRHFKPKYSLIDFGLRLAKNLN